jgi:hypothetical protein
VEPPRARLRPAHLVAVVLLIAQLVMIARAYSAPIDTFGFQMFPESSQWQADIYRVLPDGTRIAVQDPWPGGYRWEDLVDARGLGSAAVLHHADAGIAPTVFLLDAALDWVAANTPADDETAYLEAVVTLIDNGRPPTTIVLRSEPRP